VFSEIDVDGDESMSLDEFIVNRHLLGLKTLNLEEATELFHQIDDDHSGNVRE
jgi:Ca2+-binding EF-hand superfamily protein